MIRPLLRQVAVHRTQFLLELLTITIGLLIALGIDDFTEWRNHQALAADARKVLRAEIAANAEYIDALVRGTARQLELVQRGVDLMTPLQRGSGGLTRGELRLELGTLTVELLDTAFKTAQTTGALSYMPYAEAQSYNAIYTGQARLQALAQLLDEDAAISFGLSRRFNVPNEARFTPEQASQFSEAFGVWQVHLIKLSAYLKQLAELQHAYLEHRAPRELPRERLDIRKPAPVRGTADPERSTPQ